PGCRADTGVRTGDTISPWYDPMIAKVIVHGPTRAVALAQLARALQETQVAGTTTNLAFLGALARHPGFAAGDVDTGLIERDLAALTAAPAPSVAVQAAALLASAGLGAGPLQGFTLWAPLARGLAVDHAGETIHGTLQFGPAGAQITVAGETLSPKLPVVQAGGQIHVFDRGQCHSFTPHDPLAREANAGAAGNATLSPMPGLVKAVFVAPGQAVAAGDRLAVLEAMKMEHTLTAARDGVVAEVLVAPGSQVEAGAALILLAEEEVAA
ncbi:MAG: biotin/lipoyl-containing protein, partial [Gemmobacter sp.]